MKELERYRAALMSLPKGCTMAEVEAEKQKRLWLAVSQGEAGEFSCSTQTELFVRASEERTGMVYTQKLDEDPEGVILQAMENGRMSQSAGCEEMASPALWKSLCADAGALTEEESLKEASVSWLAEFARRLEREILEKMGPEEQPDGGKVQVRAGQTILTMGVINSCGLDVSGTVCRYEAEVTAEGGYQGYLSALRPEEITADYFVRGLRQRVLLRQPAVPSEPGVYRAVLASGVVNNILITMWQMFSARRKQSESTPLAGHTGERIFSPCVTIRDEKGGEGSLASRVSGFSWEIDCEGVPSQDVTLVENGVLKGWLHNLASAKEDGVPPTGNAGRRTSLSGNIHTETQIMPKNFMMEAGTAELSELLSACWNGIYIFENYDQFHALNVVTGDYAFPCKGIVIREGKPAGLVEGLTMNGNVCRLFSCVERIGKDREVCPMTLYSSYTVVGPAMLVSELKISG